MDEKSVYEALKVLYFGAMYFRLPHFEVRVNLAIYYRITFLL